MRLPQHIERRDDFGDVGDESEAAPNFARGTQERHRLDIEQLRDEHLVQIAHDLKGPLSTIALEVALVDRKLEQREGGAVRPLLARITHNLEFLDRMVHDLLDTGVFAETGYALARVPTDLRALLDTVIERSVASRDRPRVLLDAPTSVCLEVDDLRLQRVVANFLTNALHHAPEASSVVVRLDADPERCRVSVIDAGPGVTAEEAGYIFDKYRRTPAARSREGSGLGLYISKQIIEAHGGTIGVESAPGAGSRFFFVLPRSPPESEGE